MFECPAESGHDEGAFSSVHLNQSWTVTPLLSAVFELCFSFADWIWVLLLQWTGQEEGWKIHEICLWSFQCETDFASPEVKT